jgi:L-2-hydroxycarboxylate dehydrogenase (NAD+)
MYTVEHLSEFTAAAFEKMGFSHSEAETITRVFMAAELRGLPSHGMLRLKDYYELWKARRINTGPDVRIVHESPSTAVVDGDNAPGMIPATFAMETAIKKAAGTGTGWVACRNSNHFGIASYYAMMALEHDMIGITMTNTNPLVAPPFSVSRMLGTNPVAVAIPAGEQPAFVADFSSTPIARGKLAVAAKQGKKVPLGYVQDAEGNPSTDPDVLTRGGAMVTLGGSIEHGSHKGYCLSAVVDIFSAVLSGANFGPFVPPSLAFMPVPREKVGEGSGHFFGAMRIDAFQKSGNFKKQMDLWITTFRNARSIKGKPPVMIPGDIERENEIRIAREGVNLLPAVVSEVQAIAAELGLEFK